MSVRALAAAVALTAFACGTTRVHTNAPDAHIYVDGHPYGPYAQLGQTGMPGTATVVVKAADGRSKTVQVRRSFTVTTALLGLVTYGACWIFCWRYPDTVYVEFDDVQPGPALTPAGWTGGGDAWTAPPPGYQGQAAPAAAPGDGAPAAAPDETAPAEPAPADAASPETEPVELPPAEVTPPPAADDPWSRPPSGQR